MSNGQASGPILQTRDLTKVYAGGALAVDRLSMAVAAGTIYALLGPNGAGKTTTLSILTTLIRPTRGTASVAGYDVVQQPHEVRQLIGVTFQEVALDGDLTGREVMDYHGRLYGMPAPERAAQIGKLLALVELDEAAHKPVKHYSGGMKRRLELARGLLSRPKILFLDEPTQGLDPQNRASVWEHLRTLRTSGEVTILLTTHYMEEAEALADTVGIMDHGRLIVEGAPQALAAEIGGDVIHLIGRGNDRAFVQAAGEMEFVSNVIGLENEVEVAVDRGHRRLPSLLEAAGHAGFTVEEVSIKSPGLGDVFLKYTGRALRDR